jgi:EAL domain-containing protein (putative c-di-GMP-specific phosphodiesterase class I)
MSDSKTKAQRDLFMAFAFAASDLFLEVGEDNRIAFSLGAAKTLTGIDAQTLKGLDWLDIFSRRDRPSIIMMRKRARLAERVGPYLVTLDEKIGNGQRAIVTGIKMPGSTSFYMTLAFSSALMADLAERQKAADDIKLMDKDSFIGSAHEVLNLARSAGSEIDMTLLDIPGAENIRERVGPEIWDKFTASITELLTTQAIDGSAAAMIADGRYSVIHDKKIDSDTLRTQIESIAREQDPEGAGFEIVSKTVSADIASLSDREATKALVYTINEFERKGTGLNIETLNAGFNAYVAANAQKIQQFKSMIETLSFDFHFQPVVDLETRLVTHYEMLSRFRHEGSTQEWIIFGEDIGMAADFDIAVCERAINYLLYKGGTMRTRFAVNLSGQSIQNEQFFKTLLTKLTMHKNLSSRLLFEITESTTITNLDLVNKFIGQMQDTGFEVCLDDFGAGSASFQYLQKLHVDYVKIDGQYTHKLLSSRRDALLIKNLTQMCRDLDIKVIAERVENEAQLNRLREYKIGYAQGFYFGRPTAHPEYKQPPK